MTGRPGVVVRSFTPAPEADRDRGLLGFARLTVNRVAIDSVAVRRSERGRRYLKYPSRVDGDAREHPIALPLDADERRQVEGMVLAVLGSDLDAMEGIERQPNLSRPGRRRGRWNGARGRRR